MSARIRTPDRTLGVARGLGWFSIGLGLAELLAPQALTRRFGLHGHEKLIASHGAREIVMGIGILAARDPAPWIWGRVAGDALDLGTLAGGLAAGRGRQRHDAGLAMAAVGGIALLDLLCGRALSARRRDDRRALARDYGDRSGLPKPAAAMRGAAGDFTVPADFRIPGPLRPWTGTA